MNTNLKKLLLKSVISPKSSGDSFINNFRFSRSLIELKSFFTVIICVMSFVSAPSFTLSVTLVP